MASGTGYFSGPECTGVLSAVRSSAMSVKWSALAVMLELVVVAVSRPESLETAHSLLPLFLTGSCLPLAGLQLSPVNLPSLIGFGASSAPRLVADLAVEFTVGAGG